MWPVPVNPARMARQLRIQYPGAIYRVMNRGDRREGIFLDEKDDYCFLRTLNSCKLNQSEEQWRTDPFSLAISFQSVP